MAPKSRHGHSGGANARRKTPSKTYQAWVSMKRRCYDPSLPNYHLYGGRGITYAPQWEDFLNFLEDMGEAPPNTSLDRIDNNGNYEKGNCRWATLEEQNNNRRSTRFITYNGKTQSLAQWSREMGLSGPLIRQRIDLYGWSIEEALTTPAATQKHKRVK